MCHITDTGATATTPSTPPGKCNGIPNTDWSCCSDTNYCNLGEGDYDFDLDCAGSLTCGNNNCKNDFSLSGSNWASSADCCEGIRIAVQYLVSFSKRSFNIYDIIIY